MQTTALTRMLTVAAAAGGLMLAIHLARPLDYRHLLAIAAVQPINMLSLLLIAVRLHLLSARTLPVWITFKGAALSGSLLYILPSRLSEFIKPVYFSHTCHTDFVKGVAIVAVERFLDVVIVATAAALAAIMLAAPEAAHALYIWGGLAFAGTAGLVAILRWPHLLLRAISFIPAGRFRSLLLELMGEVRSSIATPYLAGAIAAGLLAWVASYSMTHVLINLAGSIPLAPQYTLLVFLAGTLGLAAAVTPGGLGTFEAGTVVALKLQGYDVTEALWLSLSLRIANLGVLPLIAAWTLAADGLGMQRLLAQVREFARRP